MKLNTDEKKVLALNKLAGVYETVLGIEPEDFKSDCILGKQPEGDTSGTTYFGADEIEMLRSMLHIEEAFNKTISDELFVPRQDVVIANMWRNRPVGDLVEFCVETLLNDDSTNPDQ